MVDQPAFGGSLLIHTTVVERQANYPNDPCRTGRTRPNVLEDVGESARAWQVMPHLPFPSMALDSKQLELTIFLSVQPIRF
jgi:hypothetical protein